MKATSVTYLDAKGQPHEALVTAVNPLNPGYLSLVYVDESRPDADNVVKLGDVRHLDTISEPNPALPTYHLNCWKECCTPSNSLPADHPAYDHPHLPTTDADGNPIPVDRPLHDADIAAHQLQTGYDPSSEGEPAVAVEPEAAPSTPRLTEDQRISALEAQVADLKAELAATTEGKDAALQSVADADARSGSGGVITFPTGPSGADLDAVAAEQKAAEATSGVAPVVDPPIDPAKP